MRRSPARGYGAAVSGARDGDGSSRLGSPGSNSPAEVFGGDPPLAKPLEQMIPQRDRQAGPLNPRHHSPKVMRANSSLRRLCSPGSRVCAKRSASSRKCFLSCSRASRPDSISSTRIRLALVRLDLASDLTRRAVPGGRLTLWRTGLSTVDIAQGYTKAHHSAPEGRNAGAAGRWVTCQLVRRCPSPREKGSGPACLPPGASVEVPPVQAGLSPLPARGSKLSAERSPAGCDAFSRGG